MKRAILLYAILLLAISASTIILHAASGQEKNANAAVVSSSPSPVSTVPPPPPTTAHPARLPATHSGSRASKQLAPVRRSKAELPTILPAKSPRSYREPTTGMEFLSVPGGCFQMGHNNGDADEKPAHNVCLKDFYIGKYEVTQGQWQQVMGTRPSFFNSCGDQCPVENISWNDAQEFISKLGSMLGKPYRLLTEAEWEYACRSGGKNEQYCGGDDLDASAWFDKNSSSKPHPVGGKRLNGLGIHDMSGNVWEWVNDRYQGDYYRSAPEHNPEGPDSGDKRVIRGGSWYNDPLNVRATIRSCDDPAHRSINLGFRLAHSNRNDE